jgi:hypothetical protein
VTVHTNIPMFILKREIVTVCLLLYNKTRTK